MGVILQNIFSGKCKADGACDKSTGECLDDTGCGNGKLDFLSERTRYVALREFFQNYLIVFMETNDISQDIVEQNVWIQIARQATVEPVVASVLGKINVSALVSGQR